MHAKFEQYLGSRIILDVLGAIINRGVDDRDKKPTLRSGLKEGFALSDARLKKDDGVLKLLSVLIIKSSL